MYYQQVVILTAEALKEISWIQMHALKVWVHILSLLNSESGAWRNRKGHYKQVMMKTPDLKEGGNGWRSRDKREHSKWEKMI